MGGNFDTRATQDFRFEIAELRQTFYARANGLEALDLMGHSPEGFLEQIDVMDEEIHRSDRDQAGSVEPVSAGHGEQRPGRQRQTHRVFDDPALEVGTAVVGKDDALVAEKLLDGIIHRATRTDIFGASQLLLEEAVHLRFGLAARFLVRDSNILQPPEDHDRGE